MTNTHPLRRRFQKPSNVPLQKQQQQKPLRKPTKPEPEPHATNVVRRGYFASGHVLINNERQKRQLPVLNRSRTLDRVARKEAEQLAQQLGARSLSVLVDSQQEEPERELTSSPPTPERQHSKPPALPSSSTAKPNAPKTDDPVNDDLLQGVTCRELSSADSSRRLVEHITAGESIHRVHFKAMQNNHGSMTNESHKAFRRNVLSTSFTELGFATAKGANGLLYVVQVFRGDDRQPQFAVSPQQEHVQQ